MSPRVGAIVLAAGGSRRLGHPKQLLLQEGETLLHRAARVALDSGAGRAVVVLGSAAHSLESELAGLNVQIVHNPDWAEGMSTSVRVGLDALQDWNPDAVLLCLCDQPYVDADLLQRLIQRQAQSGASIVACQYAGRLGVPALFTARHFPELRALTGDQGARPVLARHAADVLSVPFEAGSIDVDTPEDYDRLVRGPRDPDGPGSPKQVPSSPG